MALFKKDKSSIEKLTESLYRNDSVSPKHKEGELHSGIYNAQKDWEHDVYNNEQQIRTSETENHGPMFNKILIGSISFFIFSLLFATYMFYGGGNITSNDKINLSILGPAFAESGSSFQLQFDVKNGNLQALQYVDLIIEYPKGATLSGDKDTVRIRKFIGDIPVGRSVSQKADINLFGEEGSERTIKTTLEYRVEGSNAVFVKENSYLVHIKSSPFSMSVDSLKEVNSNQDISLNISALANSDKVFQDILIKVEYPSGFTYASANPEPTYGNNIWRLGDIVKGNKKSITINGKIQGEDREERSFRIYSGSVNPDDNQDIGVIYSSYLQTVTIKRPFLETKLVLNGDSSNNYVVSSNSTISGEITWINNLPNRVVDAEIYVKITGDVLDKNSVSTSGVGGFFRPTDNTIIWNKDTNSELATLNGSDSGKLAFSFKLLPLFSGNKTIFKNPSLDIEVGVKGRRILENNVPEQVSGSDKKNVKVNSNVQLLTKTLYYDGPFKNTGNVPPSVNKETTYSIVWTVINSSNDLSGVTVKTKLPTYVRWLASAIPASEDITYNPETREVSWNLGRVEQGTGIESNPRQTIFQIGITPFSQQVGTTVNLSSDINVSAEDSFTGANITFSRSPLSTRRSGDSGGIPGDDIIH